MAAALASGPAEAREPGDRKVILFLGPFAKPEVVEEAATETQRWLAKELATTVRLVVGDPPYDIPEDPDGTMFWVRPYHRAEA